jgi:hypothetical protein
MTTNSGEPVGEVRAKLVFEHSDVVAADDSGEDTPEDI